MVGVGSEVNKVGARPKSQWSGFENARLCQIWMRFGRVGFETGVAEHALTIKLLLGCLYLPKWTM